MPAWYDIYQLDSMVLQDQIGIKESAAVMALIESQINEGISPQRIVCMGFSQGGAIALYTALRYQPVLVVLQHYRLYLPMAAEFTQPQSVSQRIWFAHGDQDLVVPIQYGEESAEICISLGCDVVFNRYPMGHEIITQEIDALAMWLGQCFVTGGGIDE